jgi:hypothetical protein
MLKLQKHPLLGIRHTAHEYALILGDQQAVAGIVAEVVGRIEESRLRTIGIYFGFSL